MLSGPESAMRSLSMTTDHLGGARPRLAVDDDGHADAVMSHALDRIESGVAGTGDGVVALGDVAERHPAVAVLQAAARRGVDVQHAEMRWPCVTTMFFVPVFGVWRRKSSTPASAGTRRKLPFITRSPDAPGTGWCAAPWGLPRRFAPA